LIDCRGRERKRETTWMKATEKRKNMKKRYVYIHVYIQISKQPPRI